MTSEPVHQAAHSAWTRHLPWLPIPLFVAAIAVLWAADLRVAWPLPTLFWLVHYGSVFLGIAFIVIPAAHHFLARGEPSVLMLSCGVLIMDIGVIAMPFAFAHDSDTAFAIYNTSALLGALGHFIGAAITARRKDCLRHPTLCLTAAYVASLAAVGLVIWMAFTDRMPVFFVEDQGGTLLRSLVVGAAVALFALTAGLLWQANRRIASPFFFWYALGLLLLAAGLAGSVLIAVRDSPLQWLTRLTQVCGTIYMCVAVLAAARQRNAQGIPLAAVEEAWGEYTLLAGLRRHTPLGWVLRYGLVVAAIALALGLRVALTAWVGPGLPPYIVFYPAVMVVALLAGVGPGLVATAASGFVVAYWILPPVGQLAMASPVDRLGLVLFAGLGVLISAVAELSRHYRHKAAAFDRQAALRESQARLATFAEATFEGIVESEAGRIIDCNEQFARLTGYAVAELRGVEIASLIAPADRDRVMASIRQGQESVNEHIMRRKDGTQTVVETHGRPVSPGSARRHTAVRDITLRQRAEAELVQAKEEWERTFDSVPDLVAIIDAQHRILRVNRAMAQRLGRPPEQCVGGHCYEAVHGTDYPPAICPHSRTLVDRQEHAAELHEDRMCGDFWVTTTPLQDRQGRTIGSVHVARDITERKQAETARQALLRRFYDVLSSMYSAVLLVTEEGRVEFANQAFCDSFGLQAAPTDLVGLSSRDTIEKAKNAYRHSDEAVARIREILACGQPVRGEELAMQDGRTCLRDFVPLRALGRSCGRLWIHSDITARKRAEEALRQAHEWLALAQQSAGAGTWDWDMLTGKLTWSPEMFRLFGLDPAQAEPTFEAWRGILHPEDREPAEERIRQAVQNHARLENEYRIVRAAGEERWINAVGNTVYDAGGGPLRMSGICLDITDRKRAEEEIGRHVAELRASNTELERFNRAMVDRELRMIELKKQVNELCVRAGQPPRYPADSEQKQL